MEIARTEILLKNLDFRLQPGILWYGARAR